mgnify:CR=1 FL=1|nr:MAG TPA: hypothetical protein [Caudoviricetes sp.]
MKLYLKYGQVIDLGNVITIEKDGRLVKQWKDCHEDDELYCISEWKLDEDDDVLVNFYNDKNQKFECHHSDVIGILEDRE